MPWATSPAMFMHGQRRFLDTQIPCQCVKALAKSTCHWMNLLTRCAHDMLLHVDLSEWWLLLANIYRLTCAGYDRWWQSSSDIDRPMCAGYGWYIQITFEVTRPMCECYKWWSLSTYDVRRPMCAGYAQCWQPKSKTDLLLGVGQRRCGTPHLSSVEHFVLDKGVARR